MPPPDARTSAVIGLYNLCRRSSSLPLPGGILQQPAELMELFQEIDTGVDRSRREQAERQDAETRKSNLMEEIRQRPRRR